MATWIKNREGRAKRPVYDWAAMRIAFAQGLTTKEIGEKFNCPYGTVNARCAREKWSLLRPEAELHRAMSVATEKATDVWANRGREYRDLVFAKTSEALQKAVLPPPKTWKDAEIVDRVARRTIGLDDETTGNNTIVNLAVLNREGAVPEVIEPVDI